MKILGIGNAIVDVICKVKEQFISQNNLSKGKSRQKGPFSKLKELFGSFSTRFP